MTPAPKPGDLVTLESVADLPIGTVVEWKHRDIVYEAVKLDDDSWAQLPRVSQDPRDSDYDDIGIVEGPEARVVRRRADAGWGGGMTPATTCGDLLGDAPEANTPDACDGAVGPCSIGTGSHRSYYTALDAAGTCRPDPESVDPTACAQVPELAAKGCHGCRFAHGLTCSAAFASSVQTWQAQHLHPDLMTPKPNAPECPGRVSNSGN